MVETGQMPAGDFLNALDVLRLETSPVVWEGVLDYLRILDRLQAGDATARARFRGWAIELLRGAVGSHRVAAPRRGGSQRRAAAGAAHRDPRPLWRRGSARRGSGALCPLEKPSRRAAARRSRRRAARDRPRGGPCHVGVAARPGARRWTGRRKAPVVRRAPAGSRSRLGPAHRGASGGRHHAWRRAAEKSRPPRGCRGALGARLGVVPRPRGRAAWRTCRHRVAQDSPP